MNRVSDAGLAVDGIYGTGTRQAVRDFQNYFGLGSSGVVNKNTGGMLEYTTDLIERPGHWKAVRCWHVIPSNT